MISLIATCALFLQTAPLDSGDGTSTAPPTWHDDVKRLVMAHCVDCHRTGGSAPFALERPEQFRNRRTFVAHVIEKGIMPPWLPSGGGPFAHSNALSAQDRQVIQAWLAAGCPPGDGSDPDPQTKEPAPPSEQPSSEPAMDPAVIRTGMRAPWTIPAEGGPRWFKAERDKRSFALPLDNRNPLRVRAIEYHSTAPQALGAVALSADPTGDGRRMVDWDEEPGSYMMADIRSVPAGALGIIGPGGGRLTYPAGFYVPVPAGSDIMSEVHYRPQGRERILDDRIILHEVPNGEVARPLVPVNVMVPRVRLDPDERRTFSNELTLPVAIDVVALSPRASRRCTSLRLEASVPGSESPRLLLAIDDWNPHYRSTLLLNEPVRLPEGTVVRCRWSYDNSEANPRNPVVPPEKVDLGARSGAMNVLLMSAPVRKIDIRTLLDFIESEAKRNRG